MNFTNQLKAAGLTDTETKVYLFLVEQGISTPPQVAKGTDIARTNCYNVLQSLKTKGLIEEQKKNNKKAFLACDPEAILRSLDKKKTAIQEILPDLKALYTTQKNKPKIRFYDGFEQVKDIYLQTLRAKEVLAIGSTKDLSQLNPVFHRKYVRKIKDKGIVFKDILNHSSGKDLAQFKEALRGFHSAKALSAKYGDVPTDILIWDDNIALITLQEPIFGSILTNPLLAQTFRVIFEVMWDTL